MVHKQQSIPPLRARPYGLMRCTQATAGERRRVEGLERTRMLLEGVLKGLARAGWPRRRIHLFGFSQGGTVALDLAKHSRRALLCRVCMWRVHAVDRST